MLPVGYLSGETSTYHYYIKDYLGNNRIVADAHGNVEEVNHYYPYGALMGDSRNTGHPTLQVHRKGARPHSRPRLVRPRCPPLRPHYRKVEHHGQAQREVLRCVTLRIVWG